MKKYLEATSAPIIFRELVAFTVLCEECIRQDIINTYHVKNKFIEEDLYSSWIKYRNLEIIRAQIIERENNAIDSKKQYISNQYDNYLQQQSQMYVIKIRKI